MEILALTQVFEKRVINQYARHSRIAGIAPEIKETLETIMVDEAWHIEWVQAALKDLEKQYGSDVVDDTIKRFRQADEEVYQKTMQEHAERVRHLTEKIRARGKS
jgi:rubrerythrin